MTEPRAMTPDDLTRIRFVSDPQLSPDGSRIAFVVTRLSEERDVGLVGTEAGQVLVVDGGVEPATAVEGGRRVRVQRTLGFRARAVAGAELAEERGAQHDPVVLHAQPRELGGGNRCGEDVPGNAHDLRHRREPARVLLPVN